MLPENLRGIRDRLDAKDYASRTPGEDALLQELDALHALLKQAGLGHVLDDLKMRVVGGAVHSCPCCGRPL